MEANQQSRCFKLFGIQIPFQPSMDQNKQLLPFKKRPFVPCDDDDQTEGDNASLDEILPLKKRRRLMIFEDDHDIPLQQEYPITDLALLPGSKKDLILIQESQQEPTLQEESSSSSSCMAIVVSDITFQVPTTPEQEASTKSGALQGQSKNKANSDGLRRSTKRAWPIAYDAVPINAVPIAPPPTLKEKIIDLGGTDTNIVIRKELTATDCNGNQARLSMPCKKSSLDLTDPERIWLDGRDEYGKPNKITVYVLDPSMGLWTIALKKWNYCHSSSYVLDSVWNKLAKANGLGKGDTVEVWSFRVDGRLCLAISR